MKGVLVTLFVLVLLVVGVDIGGRLLAENKAADAIATRTAGVTTQAPDVTIHGFSFLAQALPGSYDKITVSSTGLTLGSLSGVSAVVDLYDVTFPLSDAIKGDTRSLVASRAVLRATMPISSVSAVLQRNDITLAPGPDGTVRLSSTVTVAGRPVAVTADVVVSYATSALRLSARSVSAAGIALPPAVTAAVAKALSVSVPVSGLPFPVAGAAVSVAGTDLVLSAQANGVSGAALQSAR